MYQCINKTYYTVQNHEKMIIKDLTNNYEKEIIDNHIQFIDCKRVAIRNTFGNTLYGLTRFVIFSKQKNK